MKKLLLSLTTIGIISIVGLVSVKALAFDTNQHHNYIDINKDGICDNYQTNLNHHHCKNYIEEIMIVIVIIVNITIDIIKH